jgi:hypothetical protein
VIVSDRNGFERSQLVLRSVYGLRVDPATNAETYLDPIPPLGDISSARLAAPLISTIDFDPSPPTEIFNTPFPEKIVLGFYASTCAATNNTLCRSYRANWDPRNFLADDALSAFDRNDGAYFGLPGVSGIATISVSQLRYYPETETDPDLLETGGGRDVVTGEEGQIGVVEISLTANGSPVQTRRYLLRLINGQWKIVGPAEFQGKGVAFCPGDPAANPQPAAERENVTLTVFLDSGYLPEALKDPVWNPGDGKPSQSGVTIEHLYENSGSYKATFTAQLTPDQSVLCTLPVQIKQKQLPTAKLNRPSTGLVCQPLIFSSAGSFDPDGTITTYQWNFGDGSPLVNGPNPTHSYTQPGPYVITLTVTDNDNLSDDDTASMTIAIPAPPLPQCSPDPCCR